MLGLKLNHVSKRGHRKEIGFLFSVSVYETKTMILYFVRGSLGWLEVNYVPTAAANSIRNVAGEINVDCKTSWSLSLE